MYLKKVTLGITFIERTAHISFNHCKERRLTIFENTKVFNQILVLEIAASMPIGDGVENTILLMQVKF